MHTSFNTSHITLYQTSGTGTDRRKQVSIHLMLLFIDGTLIGHHTIALFQYISCYSLSVTLPDNYGTFWKFQYISCYSLSMYESYSDHFKKEFQYISCYSLSVKAVQTFPVYTRFNTSHVTLYRLMQNSYQATSPFQYISCYSLSLPLTGFRCWLLRFNTSHVTLYQASHLTNIRSHRRFNTSHVTLYRVSESDTFRTLWTFQYISCYSLSEDRDRNCKKVQAFQYISCYSLSHFLIFLADRSFVSIHLMLLFISIVSAIPSAASLFQYISCYSLSLKASVMTGRNARFNTSHVTLYLNGFTTTLFSQCVSIHLMLLFILPG